MFGPIENLHHATIITGDRQATRVEVVNFLSSRGVMVDGNADFQVFEHESIGVDEVRGIVATAQLKGFGGKRWIVINCDRMTPEAQNTLLKSIEEPQRGVYFFILIPDTHRLLPTVLSRCQIRAGAYGAGPTRLDPKLFLASPMATRFSLVEQWTRNDDEEDNLSKTEVIHFLDHVEKKFWDLGNRDESLFSDIRQMRHYANVRGASHRVILDFIAMIAPVVK